MTTLTIDQLPFCLIVIFTIYTFYMLSLPIVNSTFQKILGCLRFVVFPAGMLRIDGL